MKSSNTKIHKTYIVRNFLFIFSSICLIPLWIWWGTITQVSSDELWNTIQESKISSKDKVLLHHLISDDAAWSSGLIGTYLFPGLEKRIVWQSKFQNNSGDVYNIFLLNQYLKPGVKPLFPIVCVITDEKYKLKAWAEFILTSKGVISAKLSQEGDKDILTISTVSGWTYGKGVHKYSLNSNKIDNFGEVQYKKFQQGENSDKLLVPFMSVNEFQSLDLKYSKWLRKTLIENSKFAE
ncbi:hypothetical protein F1728_19040 [Gimesia benthica]|uniref:Uncharacterized protein n=1 Tax=Gimesia benthica TaxID=2608982 RepID=A0A6I6AHE6_9PLAN|nr:hypothetical protein [Gimesia benthica]QGQ24655.1 hypothetical protein F1728_19040 [Gimesia benthica]